MLHLSPPASLHEYLRRSCPRDAFATAQKAYPHIPSLILGLPFRPILVLQAGHLPGYHLLPGEAPKLCRSSNKTSLQRKHKPRLNSAWATHVQDFATGTDVEIGAYPRPPEQPGLGRNWKKN